LYPRSFEYHAADDIDDALELLSKYGEDAKVLAGGQSLIPMMKLRLVSPKHIVDIGQIEKLNKIEDRGGSISFGALVRMSDLERSEIVKRKIPIFTECAEQIADPLVRNMGTVGGNIAHGDPNNDLPSVALVTDAKFILKSKLGRREVSSKSFYVDTFTTVIKEDEVLEKITVPVLPGYRGTYMKLERLAGDFGIAGVAVFTLLEGERFKDCRIALVGVGPTVIFAEKACNYLKDERVTKSTINRASKIASEESKPVNDIRGTEEFKRKVVSLLTEKALIKSTGKVNFR
jgi:carbon-monoxide dehydrogenase medium subunit